MINSGTYIEHINQSIAIFQTEIDQAGKMGLTDIHKNAENFIKRLLDITYNYNLKNLNDKTSNFPGLDLGDKNLGIAFQISSITRPEKVDDMLAKVLRYEHYKQFPQIKMFVIGKKRNSYSLNSETLPLFTFNWKDDIIDFSDLLKSIQNLEFRKLKEVYEHITDELDYIVGLIQGKATDIDENASLINTETGLEKSHMRSFEHWSCKLTLNGIEMTAPILHRKLTEFYASHLRKSFLKIFNPVFRKQLNSKQFLYLEELRSNGAINLFSESILKVDYNLIHYEYAQYKSDSSLLTDLNNEVGGLVLLLFFLKSCYGEIALNINLDIDLSTNAELIFLPQASLFRTKPSYNTYSLNPKKFGYSMVINDITDEKLIGIMERVLHGFVANAETAYLDQPFLTIDENLQRGILNYLLGNT